jgi:tetratricopeptide (TPR) repeat protein
MNLKLITLIFLFTYPKFLPAQTAEGYLQKGNALFDSGQWAEAADYYTQVLELEPYLQTALINRGICHLNLLKFYRAVADFTKVLTLTPGDVDALEGRGTAYFRLGEFDKCIGDLTKVLQRRTTYEGHLNRGLAYLHSAKPALAKEDFLLAQRFQPGETRVHLYLAQAERAMNQLPQAEANLRKALDLDASSAAALNELGILLSLREAFGEAIEIFDRAKKVTSDSQIYSNCALAKLGAQDPEGAMQDANAALVLDQSNAAAYFARGQVFLSRKQYEKALDDFDFAIGHEPSQPDYYLKRCLALLELGEFGEAEKDCRKVLQISPRHAEAQKLLEVCTRKGSRD